jgi:hypothetical protein
MYVVYENYLFHYLLLRKKKKKLSYYRQLH